MEGMFHKYHALGNDYLILDPARQPAALADGLTPAQAVAICDRHRGVGSDGIVYGPLPGETRPGHFACQIWNPDGSLAEVSGNGLRIFARYLLDGGYLSLEETRACWLHSGGREIAVTYGVSLLSPIRVVLGQGRLFPVDPPLPPDLLGALGKPTGADVGNPHCVFFPAGPVDEALARHWGPVVESHPSFPQRTNVQFVRVLDPQRIAIEIWERGAGYTQASGSSSCAAALAAVGRGACLSPVTVQMAGGELLVDVIGGNGNGGWQVALTGPVTRVFHGEFPIAA